MEKVKEDFFAKIEDMINLAIISESEKDKNIALAEASYYARRIKEDRLNFLSRITISEQSSLIESDGKIESFKEIYEIFLRFGEALSSLSDNFIGRNSNKKVPKKVLGQLKASMLYNIVNGFVDGNISKEDCMIIVDIYNKYKGEK